MTYELPKTVSFCGKEYAIRSDYRAVLDICAALSDVSYTEQERAIIALDIFYPDFQSMPPAHYAIALQWCYWFLDCGERKDNSNKPKLMDWEKDFQHIVGPVNRVLQKEIRDIPYLHWWTFVGAYNEIGDCLFAQIVRIRDKKAKGKKLDKEEREWYKHNRKLVDFEVKYTEKEQETINAWI